MPEPGSKRYDVQRAHQRKQAENEGIPDRKADEEANRRLQEEDGQRTRGPRTERGLGPKGERKNRG